ncbi:MAG: hypothetical protein ACLUOL_03315, partial [Faecalibacterium sp.]
WFSFGTQKRTLALMKKRFTPRHQRENLLKKRPYGNSALPRAQAREAVKKNELNGSITFPLTKENQNESLRFTL